MTIKRYEHGYRATVSLNGKEYVAELRTPLPLQIPEVTICQSRRGRIDRYHAPAYTAWPDEVSQQTLESHIALFLATNP